MPIIDVVERPTTDARPSRPSIRFRALIQPMSQQIVSGTPHQPNSMRQPKTMMKSTENPAEVISKAARNCSASFARERRLQQSSTAPNRQARPAAGISAQQSLARSACRNRSKQQGRDQSCDQGEVDGHAAQERHGAGMEPPLRIGMGQHAQPPRQAPHQGCQHQRRSQGRGHRNQQVEPIAIHSTRARHPCRALPRVQLRGLSPFECEHRQRTSCADEAGPGAGRCRPACGPLHVSCIPPHQHLQLLAAAGQTRPIDRLEPQGRNDNLTAHRPATRGDRSASKTTSGCKRSICFVTRRRRRGFGERLATSLRVMIHDLRDAVRPEHSCRRPVVCLHPAAQIDGRRGCRTSPPQATDRFTTSIAASGAAPARRAVRGE